MEPLEMPELEIMVTILVLFIIALNSNDDFGS